MAADDDALQEVPYEQKAVSTRAQTSSSIKGTVPIDPSSEYSDAVDVAYTTDDRKPPAKRKKAKQEEYVNNNRKRSSTETSDIDILETTQPPEDSYSYPEVAGVYAPLLRLRNKRERDEMSVVPLPPRTIGGLRDQIEKSKQCNCKRSHCLKLYCECFASGIHCSPICNCVSCHNNEFCGTNDRNESIVLTLERNQHAFRPRIIAIAGAAASVAGSGGDSAKSSSTKPILNDVLASPGGAHSMMGCNCKKSFCLKKYCECFHAAVYCNPPHCRCTDCQNTEGNPERERLVAKRRSQAEAAAAAAALAHQHSRLAHMSGRMAMMGDAGRTYYGAEHPSADKHGDVEHTAAAAMAAGAAAGGVDVFLPPSSYAIPMQLKSGTSYAALSFGTAGPRSMGQSASDVGASPQPSSYSTPSKQTPSRAKKQPRKRPRTQVMFPPRQDETELEKAWRLEVERVKVTFSAMRQHLKQRSALLSAGSSASPSSPMPTTLENSENSTYHTPPKDKKLQRGNQIAAETSIQPGASTVLGVVGSVESDLKKLAGAWLTAEPWAAQMSYNNIQNKSNGVSSGMVPHHDPDDPASSESGKEKLENSENLIDDEKEKPNRQTPSIDDSEMENDDNSTLTSTTNGMQPVGVTDTQTDPDLLCTEEIENEGGRVTLSDDAVRELTILAAQDAALLSKLAQSVRSKALEMAKARIRYATDTSGDK